MNEKVNKKTVPVMIVETVSQYQVCYIIPPIFQ